MKNLYLWLNLGSFIIPFVFSFHPKIQFHKRWKALLVGIAVMMLFFITWDVIFTYYGIWGFNDAYITGYKIFGLPIEEWLFFVLIPYACIFTHYSLLHFFPKMAFSEKTTKIIYLVLSISLCVMGILFYTNWYTVINFAYAFVLITIAYRYQRNLLAQFLPTFIVILIPFFLINGVLTGSGIEDQVVWYNNAENLDIRMGTIPVEDTFYAMGMLLTVLLVMKMWEQKFDQ